MEYYDPWYFMGELYIDEEDGIDFCGFKSPKSLCSYTYNAQCAYKLFVNDGKMWDEWYEEADICGCPVSATKQ
jgi:hypothetical protein